MVGVPGVVRTSPPHNSFGFLNTSAVMLPQVLKDAGYHTALVGKWHLGLESPNTPNERGFDHFHGFLGDMMDDYYTHLRVGNNYMRLNDQVVDPQGHATDIFTRWAIEYINARAQEDAPFFLYLAYNAPHTPIQPPQEWLDSVRARQPGITDTRARLVALIEHMDDGIGRVMAAMDNTGLADNTLVVFSSDNGGQCNVGANNGGLNGCKQDNLEGGIRVATGVVWPGVIAAGSQSDRVAMTMDMFPTFCEVADAVCNHEMDGRTILPTLLGLDQPAEDRYMFWVRRGDRGSNNAPYYAARYGDDKISQDRPADQLRLHNLADDPREQNDLGQDNDVFRDLNTALEAHKALADTVGWQPGAQAIVPVTLTLLQPTRGEDRVIGSTQSITWTSNSDAGDVRIEYTKGGQVWQSISESESFSDTGSFDWTVPDITSDSVKVRVVTLDGNIRDMSRGFIKVHPVSVHEKLTEGQGRTFSLQENAIIFTAGTQYREIRIYDIQGNMFLNLKVDSPEVVWNRRDRNGHEAKTGVYTVRLSGPGINDRCEIVFIP
jgi:arylsulfatase A-like enzyme